MAECMLCGVTLVGRARKFCNVDCQKKHTQWSNGACPLPRPCQTCSTIFTPKSGQYGTSRHWDAKYCRVKCRREGNNGGKRERKGVCENCNQGFSYFQNVPQRYCSVRCGLISNAKRQPAYRLHRKVCNGCGVKWWATSKHGKVTACNDCNYGEAKHKADRSAHECSCIVCGVLFCRVYTNQKHTCGEDCARAVVKRKRALRKHITRAKKYGVEYMPLNPLKVFERDNWTCQICGRKTPKGLRGTIEDKAPEIDHRIPMSKGGPHTYSNTQCACRECNRIKGNRNERGQMPLFEVA